MKKCVPVLLLSVCVLLSSLLFACKAAKVETGFADIPAGADYAEAVAWCSGQGLMQGTSEATFAPDEPLTRAMIATVLYRAAGEPEVSGTPSFVDTQAGTWYSSAVVWANDCGMIQGYGKGLFGTNDSVTREQLDVILGRYSGEEPVWTGDPALAVPATRAQVAVALYTTLAGNDNDDSIEPSKEDAAVIRINIEIGSEVFTATLADTEAAKALAERLPITVDMSELNGNEKYHDMDVTLPTASRNPGSIQSGDVMLYGNNCLVLFYKSFSTSYSYTPLGHIDDPTGLAQAVGSGSVTVTFRRAGEETASAPVFDFETKTVKLNSGYTMPINGLGTYSLTGETCVASVKAALERGVRLIDTAYMYHNEAEVGRAIRESGIPREEIFVITKLYPGGQYDQPEQAIQEALDKLDIGYIDMLLLHHPGENDVKAYKAIEKVVADGKVRSIGLSNWYVKELEEFLPQVDTLPALIQNEIHPYYQENDVIPYIQNMGIVTQGWYPLGGRGHTAELLGDGTISAIAQAHKVSSAQVILRWNLQKGVVVIPGSSNPEHIRENTELYHFELTEEEMAQIKALDRGEKHDWY